MRAVNRQPCFRAVGMQRRSEHNTYDVHASNPNSTTRTLITHVEASLRCSNNSMTNHCYQAQERFYGCHIAPRDSQCQSLLQKLIRCAILAACLPSEIQAASANQITIAQNTLTEITESYSMKSIL